MSRCKRCGTNFDYAKREGVCPKCCFYNRPDGMWQEDDSWIKNYNYEDNSYDIIAQEAEYDEKNSNDRLKDLLKRKDLNDSGRWSASSGHSNHREVDGSHIHTTDGRVVSGRPTPRVSNNRKAASNTNPISWIYKIIFIIVLINMLVGFFSGIIYG